jgi:hypothetical protein
MPLKNSRRRAAGRSRRAPNHSVFTAETQRTRRTARNWLGKGEQKDRGRRRRNNGKQHQQVDGRGSGGRQEIGWRQGRHSNQGTREGKLCAKGVEQGWATHERGGHSPCRGASANRGRGERQGIGWDETNRATEEKGGRTTRDSATRPRPRAAVPQRMQPGGATAGGGCATEKMGWPRPGPALVQAFSLDRPRQFLRTSITAGMTEMTMIARITAVKFFLTMGTFPNQ